MFYETAKFVVICYRAKNVYYTVSGSLLSDENKMVKKNRLDSCPVGFMVWRTRRLL